MRQLQTKKFRIYLLKLQLEAAKAAANELATNKEIIDKKCYEADLLEMTCKITKAVDDFDATMRDYVVEYKGGA